MTATRPGRRPGFTSFRHARLCVAMACCLASAANAQSVTGSIFGQAPAAPGTQIVIRNLDTGATRTAGVDAKGRYRLSDLPDGRYQVTVQRDGAVIGTRDEVRVNIASGTEVSFTDAVQELDRVEVRGASVAPVDISQMDTRTVFTAEQLAQLPIPRSVSEAALLAPGVVRNSSYTEAPSFGGSASSENAYYINGYPVTNPLTSLGLTSLPFDAIAQQQVLTGGYGAEFGRSTGGVINLVTKRGGNEWKGGVYTIWSPIGLRERPRDQKYPDTGHFGADHPDPTRRTDGTLYQRRRDNLSWQTTAGGWVSGPLVKDHLFLYADVESTRTEGQSIRTTRTATAASQRTGWNQYRYDQPRWAVKLDWNITDNHLLEFTGISDVDKRDSDYYTYDYATFSHGDRQNGGLEFKDDARLYVGRYTGYLTDDLTVSALYGRQKIEHVRTPFDYKPDCPYISAGASARVPGLDYPSCQTSSAYQRVPGEFDETRGWRLDVGYRIGNHELRAGYDRMDAESLVGYSYPGGHGWFYQRATNPDSAVDPSQGVIGSPAQAGGFGTQGYYAYRLFYTQLARPKVEQSAQFIEDRWQITDRWLLSLGLRNEQFSNYTGSGEKYVSQRNQWAPRLGASWDVHGDSSLKLFANAGRYHLALPNNVAVRAASGSLYTLEYFTYTGVDPVTGAPTGLNPITVDPASKSRCPGGNAVSSNLECGNAPDPRTVAAVDLKSHYQDEYIVGLEQALGSGASWGAKLTYRDLRSAIDDTCTPVLDGGCFLFNPGVGNTFWKEQADGSFGQVHYTAEQLGLPKLKRRYYALDLFAQRSGENFFGKIEYTLSRNYGNTEGQLASDLDIGGGGQSDVSTTQDWDLPQLMAGANGVLPNHRAHQLKAFGSYRLTPEWRVGGSASLASGRPRNCTSMYPTPDNGLYNSSVYWYCGLPGSGTAPGSQGYVPPSADYAASPRGSHGRAPWIFQMNFNVAYTPQWAAGLTLQADLINAFNQQTPQSFNPRYAERPFRGEADYNPLYGQSLSYSSPRYLRLTARYDF